MVLRLCTQCTQCYHVRAVEFASEIFDGNRINYLYLDTFAGYKNDDYYECKHLNHLPRSSVSMLARYKSMSFSFPFSDFYYYFSALKRAALSELLAFAAAIQLFLCRSTVIV